MSTFTLEQKRLEQIRKQLYGKQSERKSVQAKLEKDSGTSAQHKSAAKSSPTLGTESYITRDLFRVLIFSVVAISLQLLVHQALVNKWIHINFYGITY